MVCALVQEQQRRETIAIGALFFRLRELGLANAGGGRAGGTTVIGDPASYTILNRLGHNGRGGTADDA